MPPTGRETNVQKVWPENNSYLSDVTHKYLWNTHPKYFLTFLQKENQVDYTVTEYIHIFHTTAFNVAVMNALQYLYHYFILMQHSKHCDIIQDQKKAILGKLYKIIFNKLDVSPYAVCIYEILIFYIVYS